MTQVTSQAVQKVGKVTAEKSSLETAARKLAVTVQMWRGSLFQTRAASTGKSQFPTIDVSVSSLSGNGRFHI